MRLLVTGGLGFIGSNFVRYYMSKHPQDFVVNLDKCTYAANPISFREFKGQPNYRLVVGDICDEKIDMRLTKGVDRVVHFAAETHVDRSIENPMLFAQTNVIGTLTLLRASMKNGVNRFHHISTDEVYGALELGSKEKFTESTSYNPRNPYSVSKASSDFYVKVFHETYGLETTITNCSNNFGPFQHPEKLIPKTILNALENKKVPVYGDGKHVRDWLYVEDHCSAIELVLNKGKPGESYCISASNECSNIDLVSKILGLCGRDENLITFVKDRLGHDRRYALDSRKIRSELGWRPRFKFEDSLARTIDWCKAHSHELLKL